MDYSSCAGITMGFFRGLSYGVPPVTSTSFLAMRCDPAVELYIVATISRGTAGVTVTANRFALRWTLKMCIHQGPYRDREA